MHFFRKYHLGIILWSWLLRKIPLSFVWPGEEVGPRELLFFGEGPGFLHIRGRDGKISQFSAGNFGIKYLRYILAYQAYLVASETQISKLKISLFFGSKTKPAPSTGTLNLK